MRAIRKIRLMRRRGAVTAQRIPVGQVAVRFPERETEAHGTDWTAWVAPLPQGAVALIVQQAGDAEAIVYTFADTAAGQAWLSRALVLLHRKADRDSLRSLRQLLEAPEPIEIVVPEPPSPRPIPSQEPHYRILPVPPIIPVPDPPRWDEMQRL